MNGMTTGTWISLIALLVGGAAVWGQLKNEVGNLKTSLAELRAEFIRSREDQGKRIGELEGDERVCKATMSRGVPIREGG